jgi:uncharacterized Zn finger protein (UPF0148 family)
VTTAIRCPRCGREYDVTLFSFGATVTCPCGRTVSAREPHRGSAEPGSNPRRLTRALSKGSDEIVAMILDPDVADVDIAIAIERLRERAEEDFSGTGDLFERIYDARFDRLMAQWRRKSSP